MIDRVPTQRRGPYDNPPGFPHGSRGRPGEGGVPNAGGPQASFPRTPARNPIQAGGNQQPPMGGGWPQAGGQQNSMPWLQAWEGPFAAPMTPWENQGLEGLSEFAGNDFGLGGAQEYIDNVLGGEYLGGNNPNFQAIEDSGLVLKQMNDQDSMRELQSRAAAGGNALSGALMGAEGDYMRGSNAQFENMMAQLRAADYGRERGLQNDAVRGAAGLSDQRLGGYGALMGAGSIPRGIADQELAGQYGDFIRQGRDFRDAFQYPDQLAMQAARIPYPGYHEPSFGEADSTQLAQWLAQLFGNGNLGGGIGDFFGGLLGGGEEEAPADGIYASAYDGEEEQAPEPSSYNDSKGYNARLTGMQAANAKQKAGLGKASGGAKAMTILALLMQVLGIGSGSKSQKKGGSGGKSLGQGLGEGARKGIDSLFGKNYKQTAAGPKYDPKTGKMKGDIDKDRLRPGTSASAMADQLGPLAVEEGLSGDSTDWAGQSDYGDPGDPFMDSQLFGEGDASDIFSDLFDSSDWDQMGGGEFDPSGSFSPDSGGFDMGPNDFGFGDVSLGDFGGDSYDYMDDGSIFDQGYGME